MLLLVLLSGCQAVPNAHIDEGHSLGDGRWRIDSNAGSSLLISTARGFGNNVDLGLDLKSLDVADTVLAAHGKYSFINRRQGLSVAAIGGVFNDIEDDEYTGLFAGPIISYRTSRFLFSARARYSRVRFHFVSSLRDLEFLPHEEVLQTDLSIRWYSRHERFSLRFGLGSVQGLGRPVVELDSDSLFNDSPLDGYRVLNFGASFYL